MKTFKKSLAAMCTFAILITTLLAGSGVTFAAVFGVVTGVTTPVPEVIGIYNEPFNNGAVPIHIKKVGTDDGTYTYIITRTNPDGSTKVFKATDENITYEDENWISLTDFDKFEIGVTYNYSVEAYDENSFLVGYSKKEETDGYFIPISTTWEDISLIEGTVTLTNVEYKWTTVLPDPKKNYEFRLYRNDTYPMEYDKEHTMAIEMGGEKGVIVDKNAEQNRTYYYQVKAFDPKTEEMVAMSGAYGITTPHEIKLTPDTSSSWVGLMWGAVEGAETYIITRTDPQKTEIAYKGPLPQNIPIPMGTWSEKVDAGHVYGYKIEALDVNGKVVGMSGEWEKIFVMPEGVINKMKIYDDRMGSVILGWDADEQFIHFLEAEKTYDYKLYRWEAGNPPLNYSNQYIVAEKTGKGTDYIIDDSVTETRQYQYAVMAYENGIAVTVGVTKVTVVENQRKELRYEKTEDPLEVKLNWDKMEFLKEGLGVFYSVFRYDVADDGVTKLEETAVLIADDYNETSLTDSGVSKEKTYIYEVFAKINDGGDEPVVAEYNEVLVDLRSTLEPSDPIQPVNNPGGTPLPTYNNPTTPTPVVEPVVEPPIELLSTPGIADPCDDIENHFAEAEFEELRLLGIISGKKPGTCAPNLTATRAEILKIALLTFGHEVDTDVEVNPATLGSDVKEGEWHLPFLKVGKEKKIMTGYEDGTMKPNAPVTRAETLAIFLRAAGIEATVNSAGEVTLPNDISETDWYYTTVVYGYLNDIVGGYEDGSFQPNNPVTRAEMVVIDSKVLNHLEKL